MDSPEQPCNWLQTLPPNVDAELLGDFVQECHDHLQHIEAGLLLLETDAGDTQAIHAVFRAFHTVKGTAAFLGFSRVAELAHRTESLLSRMRTGDIRCAGAYADLIFRATDVLKDVVQALQASLPRGPLYAPEDLEPLLAALDSILETVPPPAATVPAPPPRLGDILVAEGKVARQDIEHVAAEQGDLPLGIALVRAGTASLPDVAQALRMQRRLGGDTAASTPTVRVRLEHLDHLLDLIGELVLAQSLVAQDGVITSGHHGGLLQQVSHVSELVQRLHSLSFAMRMVPLSATFQKMRRVARDLAQRQGKLVEFSATGEETEIDRNLVEVLTDPLLHMIRNAIDHGLETPAVRSRLGKPPTGHLGLKAYHSNQQVVIEVHDDGQGLACDKIVAQALKMGLIASAQDLSEPDIYQLIFTPGFSTASEVTDISGRGVGMDVVWQSITAMHGQITITTRAGQGTTFVVSLPLRLSMIEALLVQVGAERYLIPVDAVRHSFQPTPEALRRDTGQGESLCWEQTWLPLLRLHALFAVPGALTRPTQAQAVVTEASGQCFALLVDTLLGTHRVMVKPLSAATGPLQGFTGVTMLGDGGRGLLLDLAGVLALARGLTGPPRS
ncbi:MAG: chemotaxis protein CheA [Candidatus Tectimicrobiota bacterium]